MDQAATRADALLRGGSRHSPTQRSANRDDASPIEQECLLLDGFPVQLVQCSACHQLGSFKCGRGCDGIRCPSCPHVMRCSTLIGRCISCSARYPFFARASEIQCRNCGKIQIPLQEKIHVDPEKQKVALVDRNVKKDEIRRKWRRTAKLTRILRSRNAHRRTNIAFVNQADCEATVYWLNYDMMEIRYHRLKPRVVGRPLRYYWQSTFVTHPWIARDGRTGKKLLVNDRDVFFPPEANTIVRIRRPPERVWTTKCHRLYPKQFRDVVLLLLKERVRYNRSYQQFVYVSDFSLLCQPRGIFLKILSYAAPRIPDTSMVWYDTNLCDPDDGILSQIQTPYVRQNNSNCGSDDEDDLKTDDDISDSVDDVDDDNGVYGAYGGLESDGDAYNPTKEG